MNKTLRGFSLIEYMVYLTIFAIIAPTIASLLHSTWRTIINEDKYIVAVANCYCAHDLLLKDAHKASKEPESWKKITEDEVIFTIDQGDIGWKWHKQKLIRSQGLYNASKKAWAKQTKSVVALGLDKVAFAVNTTPLVTTFAFSLQLPASIKTGSIETEVVLMPGTV